MRFKLFAVKVWILLLCFNACIYFAYISWQTFTVENLISDPTNTTIVSLSALTTKALFRKQLQRINPTRIWHTPSITVVTAFFDIGDFGKGSRTNIRTPEMYFTWARTFRFLLNPLVVYTDSAKFFDDMIKLREKLRDRTKVFMINRNSSWAFRRKDIIRDLFNSKGYPKHYPNTVVPEYSCATHAKFDVIAKAATENYFHTDFFMWLDVGFFRMEVKKEKYFMMDLPPNFNSSRVAVNQVYNVSMGMEIHVIVKRKLDWLGGGIFIGRRNIILKYAEQYKRAVDYLLSQKLMNSEQQVLYAMYSNAGRTILKPEIDLQIYKTGGGNPWFRLGYLMRKVVENKNSTLI